MLKTVLVTGASRGIGREIALAFARENYRVVINYNRSEKEAFSLCDEILSLGKDAFPIKADVSNPNEVESMFSEISCKFGEISVLVNNAGISKYGLISDISASEWDEIFAVNTKSAFLCSRAVLPFMINKKSGSIINISSIWGIYGASCEVAYSASKAAIIGFTKALAKEVAPSGITVNAVAPGVIKTDMLSSFSEEELENLRLETPLGILGEVSDVAKSVLFLAESRFITGHILTVDGGFSL